MQMTDAKKKEVWIDHHGPKDLVQGKGFTKTEWAARSKEEMNLIKMHQKQGLDTVQSILDDVAFYEVGIATPRELREKMLREAMERGMPPGGEFTMNNGEVRKIEFEKYTRYRKDPKKKAALRVNTPKEQLMREVREQQQINQVAAGITQAVGKNKRSFTVRSTMITWLMHKEKVALGNWVINMAARAIREKQFLKTLKKSGKVPEVLLVLHWWFCYSVKRPLASFRMNMRLDTKAKEIEAEIRLQKHKEAVKEFAIGFLQAIDDNADGGLSLNELKNSTLSTNNEMFNKAAIWLQYGRNFQRFDRRGIGIVDEKSLRDAMDEFLINVWKFDGVLW